MNVLVIGSGGREHALCWKIARSPSIKKLYCSPGREGFAGTAECIDIDEGSIEEFVKEKKIDLVVVGPEAPLVAGIADRLRRAGTAVFGPGKDGARLEGSKIYAKRFMERHGIPTARFFAAMDFGKAISSIEKLGERVVVKADGLAAGKGVIVCSTKEEAKEAARRLMVKGEMGEAGREVVVEERLEGKEVSIIALCDGKGFSMLLPTQDHKRVFDGDDGPNTGGMGSYSPAEKVVPPAALAKIERKIVVPALEGLRKENVEFRGTLYCGLMMTPCGDPMLLEFNVRFGDPETQPQMLLLDEDLADLLMSAALGEMPTRNLKWKQGAAITVVLAAEGYPGKVARGDAIEGLSEIEEGSEIALFHAGTKRKEGMWVTDGGRVIGVTAMGSSLPAARERAYEAVEKIRWRGMHYRRDIGIRGI